MSNFVGTPTQDQRLKHETAVFKAIAKAVGFGLRVCMPGIIQSFDANLQTVKVDCAVRDRIKLNGVVTNEQIPTLLDVPVVLPMAGGFALTMAPQQGDECIVVFGDMCYNSWWFTGSISNQEKLRRHDLSDGFAILGVSSKQKALANYSVDTAQLRTKDGTVYLGIDDTSIVTSGTPTASTYENISASLPINIDGTIYYMKLSTTP